MFCYANRHKPLVGFSACLGESEKLLLLLRFFWLFRTLQRSGKAIAFVKIFFLAFPLAFAKSGKAISFFKIFFFSASSSSSSSSSYRKNPIGFVHGFSTDHFCH